MDDGVTSDKSDFLNSMSFELINKYIIVLNGSVDLQTQRKCLNADSNIFICFSVKYVLDEYKME